MIPEPLEHVIEQYEDLWRKAALDGMVQERGACETDAWTIGGALLAVRVDICAVQIAPYRLQTKARIECPWVCACGAVSRHPAGVWRDTLASFMVHLNNAHGWTWDQFANKFRDELAGAIDRAKAVRP